MRRLLLTGSPGWLADAFLHSLTRDPPNTLLEIRCLVLPGARPPEFPAGNPKVSVVFGRLEDDAALASAVDGCDAVLHGAGILHVRRTADWYRVNTEGTQKLLTAARRTGTRRFVFISSNAAAGRSSSPHRLMTESDPAHPLSHYGKSKQLAEKLVLESDLEGVVLRPCMFYGPPVPARHIEIYKRILTGRMPLVGHGNYARSLTHIDNLVQACRLALTHPRAPGNVYYIADTEIYTTRLVIDAMAAALETTPNYLRLPEIVAPMAYLGDRLLASVGLYWQSLHLVGEANWHVGVSIEKARSELGYAPAVSVADGMKSAIAWCREQRLL
jgi:nucleoside-diphosphate-sugar epimerase